jgi:phage gp16-like protein
MCHTLYGLLANMKQTGWKEMGNKGFYIINKYFEQKNTYANGLKIHTMLKLALSKYSCDTFS